MDWQERIKQFKQERDSLGEKVITARVLLLEEEAQFAELSKNLIESFRENFTINSGAVYIPLSLRKDPWEGFYAHRKIDGKKEVSLLEMLEDNFSLGRYRNIFVYRNYSDLSIPSQKGVTQNHSIIWKEEQIAPLVDENGMLTEFFLHLSHKSQRDYVYGKWEWERPYLINGTFTDRDMYNQQNYELKLFKISEHRDLKGNLDISVFRDLSKEPVFHVSRYLQEPEYNSCNIPLSNFPFKEQFSIFGRAISSDQKQALEKCKMKTKVVED